jgi:hypothetical protein
MDELGKLIKEGVAHAVMEIAGEHDSELGCLMSLVGQARDGDVVAIMIHQDREPRPLKVTRNRWVQASCMERRPSLIMIMSPRSLCSSATTRPPATTNDHQRNRGFRCPARPW